MVIFICEYLKRYKRPAPITAHLSICVSCALQSNRFVNLNHLQGDGPDLRLN
jgi:hypothetical protein